MLKLKYNLTISNKINIILSFIILILLVLLSNKKTISTITIPSKSGNFDNIKPVELIDNTIYLDSIIYKDKKIIVENPVNKKLAGDYLKAIYERDSLKAINLYLSAIQLRKYKQVFEDDNIKATIFAQTTGTLDSLKLDYIRKEILLDVPDNSIKYRILLGGGVGINKDLNQGLYKVNLGYQNKKGNIKKIEYLRINNQDYGVFEYNLNLFTKK